VKILGQTLDCLTRRDYEDCIFEDLSREMFESKEDDDRLTFYSSKLGSTKIDRLLEFFSVENLSDFSSDVFRFSDFQISVQIER